MRFAQRVKRSLVLGAAGAMVLSLLPAGIAAADVIDVDDVEACDGTEGWVEFAAPLGGFAAEIDCIAAFGITTGLDDGTYGQAQSVTRGQMAVFLARLALQATEGTLEIPETEGDDAFEDIENSFARDAINLLAELEITTGVTPTTYVPGGTVTRQQMASFVARAHDVLGVEFPDVDEDDFFDDVAEDNVHFDNINLLVAAGVVQGVGDNLYAPAANVTRGQMAAFLARSIGVLESQGLWNGVRIPRDTDAAELIVITDGNIGGAAELNTDDDRDDLADTENLIGLSDGEAVTIFQFSVTEDDFFIDGEAATPAAFLEQVEIGAEFSVTETATGFAHDISSDVPAYLEGTVGNSGTSDTGLAIVDAPSGVVLTDLDNNIVNGQLYTVDGAQANQATFLANISIGDFLEAEVLSTDNAGNPESFRHNLTNDTLEGVVVAATGGDEDLPATVDPNPDDDADASTLALFPLYETPAGDADDTYVVDGDEVDTLGDFNDALTVGDSIAYAVEGGDTTWELTNLVPPVVEATVVGFTAGTSVTLADGTVVEYADVDRFRLNGAVATSANVDGALSVGDLAVWQAPDAATDTDGVLRITDANLTGDVTDVATAAPQTLDLDVVGGSIDDLSLTAAPAGYDGTTLRYFVDGTEVADAAAFATAIDDALDDDDDVTLTVTGTAIATSFSVTTS